MATLKTVARVQVLVEVEDTYYAGGDTELKQIHDSAVREARRRIFRALAEDSKVKPLETRVICTNTEEAERHG